MSKKSKGINAERQLIHMFNKEDSWSAVRIAGSGSTRYPSPDILAGNTMRRLAIECKVSKSDKKYLTQDDYNQLLTFSKQFGAEPWFAVRFNDNTWYFLTLEDLEKTGRCFAVSKELAKRKGVIFEELKDN